MNFRDFRIGWRLLSKEPGYSAVVILGLSVGFAACFLLLGYVRYCLSYDAAVPEAERIYLIKNRLNIGKPMWSESTPIPYLEVAQNSGLVETSSVLQPLFSSFKIGTQVTKKVELYAVQPAFAAMFGLRAVEGDLQAALTRPDSLALTRSQARLLFGDAPALGQSLQIGEATFVVAALLADPPPNSTVSFAALTGINSMAWNAASRDMLFHAWGRSTGGRLFVKLSAGARPEALNQLLQDAADRSPMRSQLPPEMVRDLGDKKLLETRLGALPDLYFDRDTADSPGSVQHGDARGVVGLAAVAVLILLLAVTNYVNLATLRTVRRQREIAMRKLLGAASGRLVRQFLAESVLITVIAATIGLLLAQLLLPLFADLMDRRLTSLLSPANIASALLIGVAVGIAAGAYPAWIAIGVRPQHNLAGRDNSETPGATRLRRVLTVVQFSTAMALTGVTLAIAWQTYFAGHANPGFEVGPLLVVELPPEQPGSPASRGMRAALGQLQGVRGVAAAQDLIGRPYIGNNDMVNGKDGKQVALALPGVSTNFFAVLGMAPVAGRLFDPKLDDEEKPNAVVVNASAALALGYANAQDAVKQLVTIGNGPAALSVRIVGVAPDIRYESLRQRPQPMMYMPSVETTVLTVRSDADIAALARQVDVLQRQYFPNDTVRVRRMADYYAENYEDDLRMAKLLGLSALTAIAIAAFGIYVLSAHNVQRLTRQIVLRKLYGAGRGAIAALVAREFIVLLGIATVVGLPVAALSIQRYLASFVERAPIGGWTLLAALLVAALVAVAATLRHALVALRIAPAAALRDL